MILRNAKRDQPPPALGMVRGWYPQPCPYHIYLATWKTRFLDRSRRGRLYSEETQGKLDIEDVLGWHPLSPGQQCPSLMGKELSNQVPAWLAVQSHSETGGLWRTAEQRPGAKNQVSALYRVGPILSKGVGCAVWIRACFICEVLQGSSGKKPCKCYG